MNYTIVIPAIIAFCISALLGPVVIPFLRKLKVGQTVRDEGPKTHLQKNGTPTMGGIIILISITVTSMFYVKSNPQIVPILFLTAKNRETDLVEGFLAGGDDYMQKPFSYTELIARVGGLMRRYRQYGGQSDPQKEKQVFISDLVIDKDQVSVTKNGKNVELTNTEYGILLLLSENKGKVFSLQEIYEAVWKDTFLPSASNTVMVHIRNLREKLKQEEGQGELIKNKWGRGYYIE